MYTHDKHNRDQQEAIRFTNCNILCSKSADLHFKKHRSTIDALDLLQIWFKKKSTNIPKWWFYGSSNWWSNQPIRKICSSKLGSISPRIAGWKIKIQYLFNHHLLVVILWVILLFHIYQTPSKTNHYSSVASKRKKKSLGVSLNGTDPSGSPPLQPGEGFATSGCLDTQKIWIFQMGGESHWW